MYLLFYLFTIHLQLIAQRMFPTLLPFASIPGNITSILSNTTPILSNITPIASVASLAIEPAHHPSKPVLVFNKHLRAVHPPYLQGEGALHHLKPKQNLL